MVPTLRDLIAHKGHANAAFLAAVCQNAGAVADRELSELLHHTLLANRFWLLAVRELPFVFEEESRRSDAFDGLVARYAATQAAEEAWLETATDADVARILTHPSIPGGSCSVAQALLQVCMHSHGHRSQGAKLLRRHGGTPPAADFILWLVNRPRAEWPAGTPRSTS